MINLFLHIQHLKILENNNNKLGIIASWSKDKVTKVMRLRFKLIKHKI